MTRHDSLRVLREPSYRYLLAGQSISFVASASRSLLSDLHDGWQAFRTRRWLWTFVVWLSFSSLLYGCWTIVGPLIATRDLGGAAAWGFIISAQGVGGIVAGFIALRINPASPCTRR
jgi:hypothetical protein